MNAFSFLLDTIPAWAYSVFEHVQFYQDRDSLGDKMFITICYLAYFVIGLGATFVAAQTLHKGGHALLIHSFGGNRELANSISRLLVIGFSVVNLGYIAVETRAAAAGTLKETMDVMLREKIGPQFIVLGLSITVALFILSRLRRQGPTATAA